MKNLILLFLILLLTVSCYKDPTDTVETEDPHKHWRHEHKILIDKDGNLYKVKRYRHQEYTYELDEIRIANLKEFDQLDIESFDIEDLKLTKSTETFDETKPK